MMRLARLETTSDVEMLTRGVVEVNTVMIMEVRAVCTGREVKSDVSNNRSISSVGTA